MPEGFDKPSDMRVKHGIEGFNKFQWPKAPHLDLPIIRFGSTYIMNF